MSIPLPRLLKDDLSVEREIHPISVSVELNIIPLSTVSVTVPNDELITVRRFAEFFTPMGSAGIYRLRSPQYDYESGVSTLEFEHAITEVGDYLIKGKIEGTMTAAEAMTQVFAYYHTGVPSGAPGATAKWQLGSTSLLTTSIYVSFTYVSVLEAMNQILERMPRIYMTFNFNTTPWTINFALRDDVVHAEGRLSRNVKSASITYDDSELATRVFMQGYPGDATDDEHYGYEEARTITTYGVVEKCISGSSDYTEEQARQIVSIYLEKHQHPKVSIEITAQDFSRITGEAFDTFTIGKLFRLILPDRPVQENITKLYWDNVYDEPESIVVSLAEEEDTVISFASNSSSSSSGGGGGSGGANGNNNKNKYIVQIPGMSAVTVYANSAQGAINKVVSATYSGTVTVNGVNYTVVNREIQINQ